MTLLEMLAALVLSVLTLTTVGIILNDESTTWHTATGKELLQSSLVTVDTTLMKTFQGMQSTSITSPTDVQGKDANNDAIDVQVKGSDIVITTTDAAGTVQTKVLDFPNQTFAKTVFQSDGTNLIQAKLVAADASSSSSLAETMQVDFVVGAGY